MNTGSKMRNGGKKEGRKKGERLREDTGIDRTVKESKSKRRRE